MIRQRFIDQVSRFLVGGLFIFSGLIKLNDPVGTSIKMEEYFEVFGQDIGSFFHYFIPWSLVISMVLIVLEIALGIAILVYYRMSQTGWVLLGLMVFFTFLTFYSAYFNKVTDCGCFGDAIKLTPWQSFWKDAVLMAFVLHLFWYRKTYNTNLRTLEGHTVMLATVGLSVFFGVYAIRHLPFIDFRAYKVGNNIPEQLKPPEQPIIEFVFDKGGQEIRSQKYLPAEEGYTYQSSRVVNEEKIRPKIADYIVFTPDGEDLTQETFEGSKLLIVMVDVRLASLKNIERIRTLTEDLDGKVDCLILTSSPAELMEAFRHEHQLAVPYAFADATVLKTILRSNPGIALWKQGTVLGNWHHHDTPTGQVVFSLLAQP